MATVTIIKGFGRGGKLIKNQTFTLLKGFAVGGRSGKGFITVDGTKLYGCPSARIKVKSEKDFVINGELPVGKSKPLSARRIAADAKKGEAVSMLEDSSIPDVESNETDEEITTRIRKRFSTLNKLTMGVRRGDITSLFVTGAPGVGKTYGVEATLNEAGFLAALEDNPKRYEVVSGAMTPIGLYMKLFEYCGPNDVLVLDDCDMVFADETALNILKAALDTSKVRKIYWNVASNVLNKADVPNYFVFEGCVIFISNINFRKVRSERLRGHLSALMSRSHFLDLTVHTFREKMLRIEDLVTNHDMLDQFGLKKSTCNAMMGFLRENAKEFNELSLRSVIKLAGLAKTCDEITEEWEEIARESLMGNPLSYE